MSKLLKSGKLTYYSRGFITNKWKEGSFELYDDSSLVWYENENKSKPEGATRLVDVEAFICVGKAQKMPPRPKLPNGADESLLICYPKDTKIKAKSICWLICKDINELKEWAAWLKKAIELSKMNRQHKVKVTTGNSKGVVNGTRMMPKSVHTPVRAHHGRDNYGFGNLTPNTIGIIGSDCVNHNHATDCYNPLYDNNNNNECCCHGTNVNDCNHHNEHNHNHHNCGDHHHHHNGDHHNECESHHPCKDHSNDTIQWGTLPFSGENSTNTTDTNAHENNKNDYAFNTDPSPGNTDFGTGTGWETYTFDSGNSSNNTTSGIGTSSSSSSSTWDSGATTTYDTGSSSTTTYDTGSSSTWDSGASSSCTYDAGSSSTYDSGCGGGGFSSSDY